MTLKALLGPKQALGKRSLRRTRNLVLCMALVLFGCVTTGPTPQQQIDAVHARPVCCASPREFPWRNLDIGVEQKVAIGMEAPVSTFAYEDRDFGRSYFAAFALPASDRPYRLIVSSQLVERTFYPLVLFYDRDFKPIKLWGAPDFPWEERTMTEGRRVEGSGVILPADEARYFVIFTGESFVRNGRIRFESPERWMGIAPIRGAPSQQLVEPGSSTGEVRIALRAVP